MALWTALLLGLAGSLHCAGMCGPLVLALPSGAGLGWRSLAGRVCYNLGRMFTYGCLGVIFGLVGQSLALAGFQRWLSLLLGLVMLAGFLLARRRTLIIPLGGAITCLKGSLGALLRKRTLGSQWLFGALNGLLPCGLVYVACGAAASTGNLVQGLAYMALFGVGTVPMMFALSLAGGSLQGSLRARFSQVIPICVLAMAMLLILRGLGLGIPYLSPDLERFGSPCCH